VNQRSKRRGLPPDASRIDCRVYPYNFRACNEAGVRGVNECSCYVQRILRARFLVNVSR